MSYVWKKEDIEELKRLVQDGKDKAFLAEYFNRTETAIEIKVNRLGLQLLRDGRNWLEEDLKSFSEDWCDGSISKARLQKKYNRSYFSLRKKALELKLGSRPHNDEYLSISDICEEMQVSHDRVSNWLKIGLKYKKNRSGRTKYLIDSEDLLEFLESHRDMFDASRISEYLFTDEPDWLIEKRKIDRNYYQDNLRLEYTNEDDKIIVSMFKRGKSNAEIAKVLKRTESAIKYHLYALNLFRGRYNDYEIEILKENSRYMTLDELLVLLPLRTKRSLEYKCEELGIPYHTSRERCEIRDK